jgi:hypothetical protein
LLGFLFNYRNCIHCATGVSPSMLMLGRNLRCKLDLILPQKDNLDKNIEQLPLSRSRCFQVGEMVWAKWFIARKCLWRLGVVTKVIGTRMFEIYFKDYDTSCNRHVDQIRKYVNPNKPQAKLMSDAPLPFPTSSQDLSAPSLSIEESHTPIFPSQSPLPSSIVKNGEGKRDEFADISIETGEQMVESREECKGVCEMAAGEPRFEKHHGEPILDSINADTSDASPIERSKRIRKPVKRYVVS